MKRFLAFTAAKRSKVRLRSKTLADILGAISPELPDEIRLKTIRLSYLIFLSIVCMLEEPTYSLPKWEHKHLNFSSFDDSQCWNLQENKISHDCKEQLEYKKM